MNGTKYVFDTNALIEYFKGNPGLKQYHHAPLILSVVSIIEFESYPGLKAADRTLLYDFITDAEVVDLKMNDSVFIQQIVSIRSTYKIKLPDAIIAATAIMKNATIVTTDKGFAKIGLLKISTY